MYAKCKSDLKDATYPHTFSILLDNKTAVEDFVDILTSLQLNPGSLKTSV